ncbi:AmmeMemoRadiSam system protein B, partial [Thermodesulfobacteriota bacterium]
PAFKLFIICCLVCIPHIAKSHANDVRKPVWAGRFYPAQPSELKQTIDDLTQKAKATPMQPPFNQTLKALILPHAGYVYSGWTAAHASRVLEKNQFSRVILLAPDHRVGFRGGAISDVSAYETPLGLIKLHTDAAELRHKYDMFQAIPTSDQTEHSLEVILPFLQHYLGNFELIPIVLSFCDINQMATALNPLIDPNTLLVISSDLSHFLPYSDAVAKDRETINMVLNLDSRKLSTHKDAACGTVPMLVLLNLARLNGWHPTLLHYSNSGDTAGEKNRVVGYAAIAFYGGASMQYNGDSEQLLNPEQGRVLIKLARRTVMERLGQKMADDDVEALETDLTDMDFQTRRGTFVTLHKDGRLRGCIGSLTPRESIIDSVRHNAINAAFHDYRFSQLTPGELDKVDFEVSILTEPVPLEYLDSDDLLGKLRVGVDGVIIRKDAKSATFLPQVWDQLPRSEDFLSHLCRKAGLSSDAWRKTRLDVLTYQVQYFEENK